MRKITIIMSLILVVAGLIFFFASESRSATALIPSLVGAPLLFLGLIYGMISDGARKNVAHLISLIAALGTLAGFGMGIPGSVKAMRPEYAFGLPIVASLILGICCLMIVVAAVHSFIATRKARHVFSDQDTVEENKAP